MLAKLVAQPSTLVDALPHLITDYEDIKDFKTSDVTLKQVLCLHDKVRSLSNVFSRLVEKPEMSFKAAADAAEVCFYSPLVSNKETGVVSRTIQLWGAQFVSRGCKFTSSQVARKVRGLRGGGDEDDFRHEAARRRSRTIPDLPPGVGRSGG